MAEKKNVHKIKKLNSIRDKIRIIKADKEELNALKEMAKSLQVFDYSKDRIKSSISNDNKNNELIEAAIDLENHIKKNIASLLREKLMYRELIDELDDSEGRLLLQLRYINCKSWEEVRYEMGEITQQSVYRIQSRILEKIKI